MYSNNLSFNPKDYGFVSVSIFEDCNLAVVKKNCENNIEYGIFDMINKKIIIDKLSNVDIDKFSEGMLPIAVSISGIMMWGYFNVEDRTVVKPQYKNVDKFENGFAFVYAYELYPYDTGVINKKGYEVISARYRILGNISDDFLVGYDYIENGYLLDKNWHKMPFPTTFPLKLYLGKNKFGYESSGGHYKAKYTFYLMTDTDFILVKSEDNDGKMYYNAHYYVTDFNGQRIDIENLHIKDNKKVKRFIKQKI